MKLLIPILSFFLGNAKNFFREPSEAITQQVILKTRSLVVLVVMTIGSLVIGCVGFSLLIAKLADQMDADGEFIWTPGLSLYLVVTVLSTATLFYGLRRKTWIRKTDAENRSKKSFGQGTRPIENAVALLLMDFLEQRKFKRQQHETDKP